MDEYASTVDRLESQKDGLQKDKDRLRAQLEEETLKNDDHQAKIQRLEIQSKIADSLRSNFTKAKDS